VNTRNNVGGVDTASLGGFGGEIHPSTTPISLHVNNNNQGECTPEGRHLIQPPAHQPRRRTQRMRPYTPISRGEEILGQFEIIDTFSFAEQRKAIALGTVQQNNKKFHMLKISTFNRYTGELGAGGIRLFVDQFTKILRNANTISESLKSVQRREVHSSQLLLGDGVYTYVCTDNAEVDIRYYGHADAREEPTDIFINLDFDEWQSFIGQGLRVLKNIQYLKRKIIAPPEQGSKEIFYRA